MFQNIAVCLESIMMTRTEFLKMPQRKMTFRDATEENEVQVGGTDRHFQDSKTEAVGTIDQYPSTALIEVLDKWN